MKYIRFLTVIFVVSIVGKTNLVHAQQYSEYDLKGIYLFNFANFVTWPKETFIIWPGNQPTTNYYIGVYGENPFDDVLEIIAKQRSKLNINWHISYFTSIEQIDTCNVLFVSNIKTTELMILMKHVRGRKILTVGDEIENFCELGGIINFTTPGSAKNFEINNTIAISENLIISPKLLKLAVIKNSQKINDKNKKK